MRIAAISDIHGNLPALETVLSELPDVDLLVNAGDIVGYNPWPSACVEQVRDHEIPSVMGNHDRAVVRGSDFRFNAMAAAGVEHARDQLSDAQHAWLGTLPPERHLLDGRVKIVHGHPEDPDRYTYPSEFTPTLLGEEDLLVMGHTHVQHAEVFEEGMVVNPGSVGQPRDGDPEAAYALIDLAERTVDTYRVSYDIERVQAAIAEAELPRQLGDRLAEGR